MSESTDRLSHLPYVCCPCLDRGQLLRDENGIWCERCNRSVAISEGGILDLLDPAQMDEDAKRELREHSLNWSEDEIARWILVEQLQLWRTYYTLDRQHAIKMLAAYLQPFADRTLCFLGVGTGREIEYLMHFVPLRKVLCSDISASNLKAVKPRLAPYPVEVSWLFASDLNNCPVTDRDLPIVVVNALHHTSDMHESLRRLLGFGCQDLFLVEPTDNWLIRFFARFGWAQRVEYSGVKPGRLSIPRLRAMCVEYGYALKLRTLWSFPPDYYAKLGMRSMRGTRGFLGLVKGVSTVTAAFEFGNGCVAHLQRTEPE